jgi:hypothetical protein
VIFDTDKLMNDAAYRDDMRHRCLTDHFFLAELLGFKDFNERVHRPAVNLYFPKNPNVSIREQHPIKKRMHLDPRGTFKTTLGRVDSIQWLLAFSTDITMLNETATQPLAIAISKATVKYFNSAPGKPRTPLQLMFPEITTSSPKVDVPWDSPNRKETGDGDLDKTVAYTSPQSEQSGWHPWVINPDDMVATENSGIKASDTTRKNVISTYYTNVNTLRRGGYINVRGTRYHPFDLYGDILGKIDREHPEKSGWKLLIRSALITAKRMVPGEFPAEEDVQLCFPELVDMDYAALRQTFYDDFETFMCQQMNDPQGGNVATFPEAMYMSCQIEASRVPYGGHDAKVYVCWRPRYGGKSGMEKYLEGAAAKIVDGKVYVIGAWQTTRTPSGEAELIVQVQKDLQADGVMLLDVPGSNHMSVQIRNEAARRNVSLRLQWLYWNEDDATRASEIKALEPMMKVGRVMFSTGMSKAGECQKQFVHYGLVEETGIIECVSKFADMVPLSQMRANMEEEELERRRRQRDDAQMAQVMMQSGMSVVDEQLRRRTEAHMAAMQQAVTHTPGGPPLPGGLDG